MRTLNSEGVRPPKPLMPGATNAYELHGIGTSLSSCIEAVPSPQGEGFVMRQRTVECPCGWKIIDPGLGVLEFHYSHCSEAQLGPDPVPDLPAYPNRS